MLSMRLSGRVSYEHWLLYQCYNTRLSCAIAARIPPHRSSHAATATMHALTSGGGKHARPLCRGYRFPCPGWSISEQTTLFNGQRHTSTSWGHGLFPRPSGRWAGSFQGMANCTSVITKVACGTEVPCAGPERASAGRPACRSPSLHIVLVGLLLVANTMARLSTKKV